MSASLVPTFQVTVGRARTWLNSGSRGSLSSSRAELRNSHVGPMGGFPDVANRRLVHTLPEGAVRGLG